MRISIFKKQVPEAVKEQTKEIKENYETNKLVESIIRNEAGIMPKVSPLGKSVTDYLERLKQSYK